MHLWIVCLGGKVRHAIMIKKVCTKIEYCYRSRLYIFLLNQANIKQTVLAFLILGLDLWRRFSCALFQSLRWSPSHEMNVEAEKRFVYLTHFTVQQSCAKYYFLFIPFMNRMEDKHPFHLDWYSWKIRLVWMNILIINTTRLINKFLDVFNTSISTIDV